MKADLLFRNGFIRPLGRHGLRPLTHLAVQGGRVAAGGGPEVEALAGPGTRVVDLAGAWVLPGFDDPHAHVVYDALGGLAVDLRTARDIASVLARLRVGAARLPPGAWLLGRGYSEQRLAEGRPPTRRELDAATGDRPAYVDHFGGHARVANSAALAAAGLGAGSPDPPGGSVGRDPDGELDGLLRESAMRLVADVQPAPPLSERVRGLVRLQRRLLAAGVTSVGAAVNRGFADDLRAFTRLADSGRLRLRVNQFLSYEVLDECLRLGLGSGSGSAQVRTGPLKIFVDGGASPGTVALRPKPAPEAWRTPPSELREMVRRASAGGLQVACHCMGDAAIAAFCDAVEAAGPEALRLRHRVEHCVVCPPDLRDRLSRLGMVAVMQPRFAVTSRDRLADTGVRRDDISAYRELSAAGVEVAFSSDLPFTDEASPWAGMAAAIADPDQRITVLQALRAYTAAGAWTSFQERAKGTLEPGRWADLQVYVEDPMAALQKGRPVPRPRLVVVGGEPAFKRRAVGDL